MDSLWEGSEKTPQEWDLGFQLNCQGCENLGGKVRYIPWEDSEEGERNERLAEEKCLCFEVSVFFHSMRIPLPLSFALSVSRTDAAPWWCTWKQEHFIFLFFPCPPANNLQERLTQVFSKFIETCESETKQKMCKRREDN